MKFHALETSLSLLRALRFVIAPLRVRDAKLYDQIRRAATSISLNIAEGNYRGGKDRQHHFRIAAGSASEVETGLCAARDWGDLSEEAIAEPLELIDRILAMLWKLTH